MKEGSSTPTFEQKENNHEELLKREGERIHEIIRKLYPDLPEALDLDIVLDFLNLARSLDVETDKMKAIPGYRYEDGNFYDIESKSEFGSGFIHVNDGLDMLKRLYEGNLGAPEFQEAYKNQNLRQKLHDYFQMYLTDAKSGFERMMSYKKRHKTQWISQQPRQATSGAGQPKRDTMIVKPKQNKPQTHNNGGVA